VYTLYICSCVIAFSVVRFCFCNLESKKKKKKKKKEKGNIYDHVMKTHPKKLLGVGKPRCCYTITNFIGLIKCFRGLEIFSRNK